MLASLVPFLGALVVLAAVLFALGTLTLSLHGVAGQGTKGTPEEPSAAVRPDREIDRYSGHAERDGGRAGR